MGFLIRDFRFSTMRAQEPEIITDQKSENSSTCQRLNYSTYQSLRSSLAGLPA
jgi:hypothetical protein